MFAKLTFAALAVILGLGPIANLADSLADISPTTYAVIGFGIAGLYLMRRCGSLKTMRY